MGGQLTVSEAIPSKVSILEIDLMSTPIDGLSLFAKLEFIMSYTL
jgi:hypothetical protein